jgi:valyl-tRNA synthetase
MAISKTYDPSESEDKWYKIWTDQGLFNSEPDDRESYTVVIPPPNVTWRITYGTYA